MSAVVLSQFEPTGLFIAWLQHMKCQPPECKPGASWMTTRSLLPAQYCAVSLACDAYTARSALLRSCSQNLTGQTSPPTLKVLLQQTVADCVQHVIENSALGTCMHRCLLWRAPWEQAIDAAKLQARSWLIVRTVKSRYRAGHISGGCCCDHANNAHFQQA